MALFVTNDFPPNHGGIQRMMSVLAREFALRDERVHVVAPQQRGSAEFDAGEQFRVSRYPQTGRLGSFIAMSVYVLWACLTSRDSLTIASMWFPAGLAAGFVPRAIRGRLAVFAHGTEIAPSRGGLRGRLMRSVFERADIVVASSGFARRLLIQAGVRREISVVYPGIDATPIQPVRSSAPTIVSVGRLVARKGFDTTIAALPQIVERFPAVRYEIVGAGAQRAELEASATRLGVRDHVFFLGSVSDAEMRAAYARAWVFALPVRTIGDDVEGFGMVYLEAALAELPAVGGRNSGAEDAIVDGETGLLVDGRSPGEVAVAIIALLSDRAGAQRMGVAGRERALREFTWQRSAAELARAVAPASAATS